MTEIINSMDSMNNSIVNYMYRYGNYYECLENNMFIDIYIKKNKNLILLLNNKLFNFISSITVEFNNDFDNKPHFNKLPKELNDYIYSYLVDKKSISYALYNIKKVYDLNLDYNINNNKIIYNLNFMLKDKFSDLMNKNNIDFSEFINKIPNYLINDNEYGIEINSKLDRNLKINIAFVNYNNENFYEFTNVYLKSMIK